MQIQLPTCIGKDTAGLLRYREVVDLEYDWFMQRGKGALGKEGEVFGRGCIIMNGSVI